MFLIFGQFWNQTRHTWDWQQIGGNSASEDDAHQYAEGFAKTYGVCSKVLGRHQTVLYLPPFTDAVRVKELNAEMLNNPDRVVMRPPYF